MYLTYVPIISTMVGFTVTRAMKKRRQNKGKRRKTYASNTKDAELSKADIQAMLQRPATFSDIQSMLTQQTALLNPSAANLQMLRNDVTAAMSNTTVNNDERQRILAHKRNKLLRVTREMPPPPVHSQSTPVTSALPVPLEKTPKPVEQREYHERDPLPPEGEDVWTATKEPSHRDGQLMNNFFKQVFSHEPDNVKELGFNIIDTFLQDQMFMDTPDTLVLHDDGQKVSFTIVEFKTLMRFLATDNYVLEGGDKLGTFLHILAKDMSTKNTWYKKFLKIPTTNEAKAELGSRLGMTSVDKRPEFIEWTKKQMLLERIRDKIRPQTFDTRVNIDKTVAKITDKEARGKAQQILQTLNETKILEWTEKGELKDGDTVLEGSDITKIIQYVYGPKPPSSESHFIPKGTDAFLQKRLTLMTLNAPDEPFYQKLKTGTIKIARGTYNVVDFFYKFFAIFKALGMPIEAWLALVQYMTDVQFKTLTQFIEKLPLQLFVGKNLTNILLTSLNTGAGALDWVDLSPGVKAGVTYGLGTALRNLPLFLTGVIGTLGAYLGYNQLPDIPRLT